MSIIAFCLVSNRVSCSSLCKADRLASLGASGGSCLYLSPDCRSPGIRGTCYFTWFCFRESGLNFLPFHGKWFYPPCYLSRSVVLGHVTSSYPVKQVVAVDSILCDPPWPKFWSMEMTHMVERDEVLISYAETCFKSWWPLVLSLSLQLQAGYHGKLSIIKTWNSGFVALCIQHQSDSGSPTLLVWNVPTGQGEGSPDNSFFPEGSDQTRLYTDFMVCS